MIPYHLTVAGAPDPFELTHIFPALLAIAGYIEIIGNVPNSKPEPGFTARSESFSLDVTSS